MEPRTFRVLVAAAVVVASMFPAEASAQISGEIPGEVGESLDCSSSSSNGGFTFRRSTNDNSSLFWSWLDKKCAWHATATWRAGAGVSQDECESSRGWLPVGNYDLRRSDDNRDSVIKGRAIGVEDKRCNAGLTIRSALFIHTEETKGQGQHCPTSGDDPYCWEGNFDYKSLGCIKVAHPNNGFPDTIGAAHHNFHNNSGTGCHGWCSRSMILQVI